MIGWIIPVIMIAAGLLLLTNGADWLVGGASSLARRLGIAPIVIGLTIVALGTSAPELVVNLVAAVQGRTGVAIGNIVGSNIANVLLILGICAWIVPLTMRRDTVWKEIPLAFLASLLVWLMASDTLLTGRGENVIDRIDGIVLLSFFVIFIYYTFGISKVEAPKPEIEVRPLNMTLLLIVAGLVALGFGGKLTVDGAVSLAKLFGVSEGLIGLTIVAIGTSLPELVTSVAAARQGHADIAIGNIVGSTIFNVFWILGISAVISPLPVSHAAANDALVGAAVIGALFLTAYVGQRRVIERWQGALFVVVYVVFMGLRALMG